MTPSMKEEKVSLKENVSEDEEVLEDSIERAPKYKGHS